MPDPRSHIPLRSVELDVLLSVVHEPRHGYAILQEAETRGEGRAGFEIPTLYRALRRMRSAGLIAVAAPPEPDVDERREYWIATALGREVLEADLSRLEAALVTGRRRLGSAPASEG